MVGQVSALLQVLADDVRDVAGLVLLVLGGVHLHLVAGAVVRPQGLALALGVVLDDAVGGVQNVGGGTVVLLQTDGFGAGVELFKVEDVLDGGPAEAVDALVIVAHHADVALRAGEQADQPELRHAGVLILVHQQIAVLVLVELPHVRVVGQQLNGLVDQIVKVKGTGLFQLFFVGGVDLGRQRALGVPGGGGQRLLRADQLILPAAHLVDGALDGQELVIHVQFLVDGLHDPLGVIRVVDGETAGIADLLRPAAQDAHAGRVEGGGKHLVPFLAAQHPAQALLQLPGRLVGEGDGHHVPAAHRVLAEHPVQPEGRVRAGHDGRAQSLEVFLRCRAGRLPGPVGRTEPDEVCNAVDQHGGLAGTGTGQNEQRAVGGKHRPALHLVQPAELFFNVGIAQCAKFLCQICRHGSPCLLVLSKYSIPHFKKVVHKE